MQVGVLPVVHGSALVSHGASQALATAVVGDGLADQAKSEGITGEHRKQLMVQMNDRIAATSQVRVFVTSYVCLSDLLPASLTWYVSTVYGLWPHSKQANPSKQTFMYTISLFQLPHAHCLCLQMPLVSL